MKVSKLLLSSMAISVLVACQPGGSLNEKEIQDL